MLNPDLPTYTRRQKVALDRPELEPSDDYCTRDPFKRKVEMVDHAGKKIQLVSALQIDMDDWPTWHAWVGFIDMTGRDEDKDYHIPRRLWTDHLYGKAFAKLQELRATPDGKRDVQSTWHRERVWHWLWKTTPLERDMVQVKLGGGLVAAVKLRDPVLP